MMVELSAQEIAVIDLAMQAWEKEPEVDGLLGGMVYTVFCRDEAQAKAAFAVSQVQAKKEKVMRQSKSLLLRAKLAQACARDSEHTVPENEGNNCSTT